MTTRFPPCFDCQHYQPKDRKHERCDAFPRGIPRDIREGKNRHREPFPGDHGLRWTPLQDVKHGDHDQSSHGRRGGGEVERPTRESVAHAAEVAQHLERAIVDRSQNRAQAKVAVATRLAARLENNTTFKKWAETGGNDRNAQYRWTHSPKGAVHEASHALVQQWAVTVGDSNEKAVLLQRAIKDEFDLDEAKTDHFHVDQRRSDRLYEQDGPALRAFARAMYEDTQDFLRQEGIDSVVVYRGMGLGSPNTADRVGLSVNEQPGTATVIQQPGASWTYDPVTAMTFANALASNNLATVMVAEVPAERILSTAKTGIGARTQGEMVVLGGEDEVRYLTRVSPLMKDTFTRSDMVELATAR